MKFELKRLKYNYDFIEPIIDKDTMEIHHSKHHMAYINNLNTALEIHPSIKFDSLEEILKNINILPDDIKQSVINNAGGALNHNIFFDGITNKKYSIKSGELYQLIIKTFGSFDEFKEIFKSAATSRFGSGWAWLVLNNKNELEVISTANQDNPLMENKFPILGLDVWEHAYYLKYQNRRPEYVNNFFDIINFEEADNRLILAKKHFGIN
ncbi:MAG: superoxide dismutase [Clostridiales bacterium]|nr:superoxide dismutase [Clostridiales bacterium]